MFLSFTKDTWSSLKVHICLRDPFASRKPLKSTLELTRKYCKSYSSEWSTSTGCANQYWLWYQYCLADQSCVSDPHAEPAKVLKLTKLNADSWSWLKLVDPLRWENQTPESRLSWFTFYRFSLNRSGRSETGDVRCSSATDLCGGMWTSPGLTV